MQISEEKSHVQNKENLLTRDDVELCLNGTLGSNHHRYLAKRIYQSPVQDVLALDPIAVMKFIRLGSPAVALALVRRGLLRGQHNLMPDVFIEAIKDRNLHMIAWELQHQEEVMSFSRWDRKNLIFEMSWTDKGYKLPLRKIDDPVVEFVQKYILNEFDENDMIRSVYFLHRPEYEQEVLHVIRQPKWMHKITGRLDQAPWLNLLILKASPYLLASMFVNYYEASKIPLDLSLSNSELMDESAKTLPNKSNIKQQFQWSLLLWTFREKIEQAVQYAFDERPESVSEISLLLKDMSKGHVLSPRKGSGVHSFWASIGAAAIGNQNSFGRDWFLKEHNPALRQVLIMMAAAHCQYSFVKNQVQKWNQELIIHSIYALSIAPELKDECQTLMNYLHSKLPPRLPQHQRLLVSIGFNLIQFERYDLFNTMARLLSPLPDVQQVAVAERRHVFVYKIMEVLVLHHNFVELQAFYGLLRSENANEYISVFVSMVPILVNH